jgi:hypothetical protein
MKMLERHYDQLTKEHPDRTEIESVDITAAARWFLEGSSQENWDLREDFPIVTPPFRSMWMEFEPPKTINSNGRIIAIPRDIDSIGCMSMCIEVADGMGTEVIRQDALRRMLMHGAASQDIPVSSDGSTNATNAAALEAGREARWIVFWRVYCSTSRRQLEDMESIAAYIDGDGRMITENYIVYGAQDMLEYKQSIGGVGTGIMPFLFALSLMHAKNVSLEPIALASEIQRRRKKDGKPCLIFKVLQINPIRQQSAGAGTGSGPKRAMHIVRGHFKDYRNGGGLFGKMKGLYWWDMHVAGDIANGQVVKDYAIGEIKK